MQRFQVKRKECLSGTCVTVCLNMKCHCQMCFISLIYQCLTALYPVICIIFCFSPQVLGPLSLQSPSAGTAVDGSNGKCCSPSGEEKSTRRSLSLRKTPEQNEKQLLREQTQQGDNCHVQQIDVLTHKQSCTCDLLVETCTCTLIDTNPQSNINFSKDTFILIHIYLKSHDAPFLYFIFRAVCHTWFYFL